MPTEPAPITLSQVVHRAVEVCDPAGTDADLADFLVRFEDADEPVAGLEDIEQRMAEAAGALDPEGDIPVLQMAAAVATYLAFRRDEFEEDPEELLRLAARAEFNGNPPAAVAGWLEEQGVVG
jgi:sirohydrochlorin ferrochelatase